MEEVLLSDPAFWVSDRPIAPGSELPEVEGGLPGLVYFRTSGSTGEPKWIGLSREALLVSAAVVNRHLGVKDGEIWGLALPLHHVGGFGVVARAFEAGCGITRLSGRWDPVAAVAWMRTEDVAHCPLVPTQVHDLVAARLPAPPALRTVVVGGGALSGELGNAARELGWPVLASYGMTEAASQIATQPPELLGSPYVPEPIEILPHWRAGIGEGGRLEIEGPSLFAGVLEGGETGCRFIPRAPGPFTTSDRVRITGSAISVIGRADRCVKVLGELVDLDELERVFGVDSMVVDLPHPRNGRELVLVTAGGDANQKLAVHNATVAGPWKIGRMVRVPVLPRTPLGKPDRREARRLAAGSAEVR